MAILVLLMKLHATVHALLYLAYQEARDDWEDVTRWVRPYYWIVEDHFWIFIAVGQLVL